MNLSALNHVLALILLNSPVSYRQSISSQSKTQGINVLGATLKQCSSDSSYIMFNVWELSATRLARLEGRHIAETSPVAGELNLYAVCAMVHLPGHLITMVQVPFSD